MEKENCKLGLGNGKLISIPGSGKTFHTRKKSEKVTSHPEKYTPLMPLVQKAMTSQEEVFCSKNIFSGDVT